MKSSKTFIPALLLLSCMLFPVATFAQEKTTSITQNEEKKPETIVIPRILRQGSYGKDVYGLQTILTELGYYTGFNTGIFGPKTTSAVNAFKKKHNLPINGIVDQPTISAIANVSRTDIVFDQPQVKKTKIATTETSLKPVAVSKAVAVSAPEIATNTINVTSSSIEDTAPDTTNATENSDGTSLRPECFVSAVDSIIECNTTISGIEYVVKPQNKKAVIKIASHLLSKKSVISLKPIFEGKPSKWMLNVGNSKFNDGWGGGMPSDSYNAEFQIVDGIFGVFKGDNGNKTVSGAKTLFARDITESLEESEIRLSQGEIEFISKNPLEKPVIIKDKNLFVFELSDNDKKDIYIGLNRTIYDADRNGAGLKGIIITISSDDTPQETLQTVN